MNLIDLKYLWTKSTLNKIYILFTLFMGLFFLFSLVAKVMEIDQWLDFNYELTDNKIGYVNGIVILLIELYFSISFLLLKISRNLLILCFAFILFLTIFVLSNKDLFKSCMCFGSLIVMKPDFSFIFKNSFLLFSIILIYIFNVKIKNV